MFTCVAMPPTCRESNIMRKTNKLVCIFPTAILLKTCVCSHIATTSSVHRAHSHLSPQCITTSHSIGYTIPKPQ